MTLMLDATEMLPAVSAQAIITDDSGNTVTPQRVRIVQSRMSEASTFDAVISVSQDARQIPMFENGSGISIYAGITNSGLYDQKSKTKMFSGSIDRSHFNLTGNTIRASGRDYSSKLIDYEISGETLLNMTASDAIKHLCGQVGLEADVDSTSGFIGQFYQYEHKAHALSGMHRYQTAWDVCVGIQRDYGYDLWVDGQVLYFKKKSTDDVLNIHYEKGSSNNPILDISLSHNLLYSDNIQIVVSSWDARQRVTHTAQYPEGGTTGNIMNFTAPVGYTVDQCKNIAEQRYKEVTAHSKVVDILLHPSMEVNTRQIIKISGTNTSFDSYAYTVDQVVLEYAQNYVKKKAVLRPR